jgi:hypothetical protein
MTRHADFLLPVWVTDLPAEWAFQPDGQLREKMRGNGVLKVVAGPTQVHVLVNVQRPYFRPHVASQIEAMP